ncbi:MAG: transposase [Nitrospirae bacterium]|nr:transposase [Nitrospirota bacterium]
MARKPRIEYEGAFYHVITRGNQRQTIFREEKDYIKYLEILSRYKSLSKYRLYAYVLMNNHVHLLTRKIGDVGSQSAYFLTWKDQAL